MKRAHPTMLVSCEITCIGLVQSAENCTLERLLREIDIVYKMGHDVGALEDSKWVKNETT